MTEVFRQAERLLKMPPYIFSEVNRIKAEAQKKGISLLSLAIGDPDLATPKEIVQKIQEAASKPENHAYSPYEGTREFRVAVSDWFLKRFSVSLNPDNEVIALIGSKEGIAHFPLAFCNPGDTALYPSPGYPVFQTSILLGGATPVALPLRAENQFQPDPKEFRKLCEEHKPKYALLNFPSNPVSVVCSKAILTEMVSIAKELGVFLVSDNAYSEIYCENEKPLSLLEIPGAKDIAIEFHSFSKTYSMTGWRLGFAVGNKELVAGLLRVKTQIDSGPLLAVQEAAIYALNHSETLCQPIRDVYAERRSYAFSRLKKAGYEFLETQATFFVWIKVPGTMDSMSFTKTLIEQEGLVVTPGVGFGEYGEGYFRLSLTVPQASLVKAFDKLEHFIKS